MRTVIGYIVLFLLIAGSICGLYFGVQAFYMNKQIDKMYTEEEVKEKEDTAYDQGCKDATDEFASYDAVIAEYLEQIAEYEEKSAQDEQTIEDLTEQNTQDQATITDLEAQNATLQQEKAELQNSNSAKDEEISELNAQITQNDATIASLESTIAERQSTITQLNSEIETLQGQITSLNNEVTRLTAELEAYKDMELTGVYNIEFLNGDTVVASTYVEEGDSLYSIPEVANTQDTWFYGWTTTEGSKEVFDFTNYIPTQDQTFYAIIGECVNFMIYNHDNSAATEKKLRVGADLTIKEVLTFTRGLDVTADENLIFTARTSAGNETVDLNMKIVDLPYGNIAYDGNGNCVKAYVLNYRLMYQYSSDGTYTFPETGYPEVAVEDYLVDYTTIAYYSANLSYVLNSETVETKSIVLNAGVKTVEFENGVVVNFVCTPKSSKFWVVATATNLNGGELCLSDVTCQFSLSTEYVRVIESAVDIDLNLYWEAEA